jgi:hypothetical protein
MEYHPVVTDTVTVWNPFYGWYYPGLILAKPLPDDYGFWKRLPARGCLSDMFSFHPRLQMIISRGDDRCR